MSKRMFVLFAVAACSGGSSHGTLAASDFVTQLAKLDCDEAFKCMASFPAMTGATFADLYGPDAATCYTDNGPPDELQQEIAAGKIMYDAAAAATCAAGITYGDCASFWQDGA